MNYDDFDPELDDVDPEDVLDDEFLEDIEPDIKHLIVETKSAMEEQFFEVDDKDIEELEDFLISGILHWREVIKERHKIVFGRTRHRKINPCHKR